MSGSCFGTRCVLSGGGESATIHLEDLLTPSGETEITEIELGHRVGMDTAFVAGRSRLSEKSGSAQVTPRFPPAGPDGHGSPPSAVLSERYDFLLPHVLRLIDFASRLRRRLPGFVFAKALPPPCRPDDGPGSGLFTLAVPFPAILPTGKSRISQVPWRSIP